MACLNGKVNIRKQIIVNYIFFNCDIKILLGGQDIYSLRYATSCYNKNNLTLYLYQKPLYSKAIFKGLFSLDAVYCFDITPT